MLKKLGWLALLAPIIAQGETVSQERQQQLTTLLRQDCGSCHGMLLKGGLGPPLLPEDLQSKSNAVLVDTILNGRPGTAMPPWREFLSPAEAAWLVDRLRNPDP